MDKIAKQEAAILQIINEYAAVDYANLDAVNRVVIDRQNNNYQLVTMGWEGANRVHAVTLHFEIADGKIYIQQDQTEYGTADQLAEMGIPKMDIVPAYLSLRRRQDLDFATA